MKFKATMHSTYLLSAVLQTLEKLGQSCVVHFSPTKVLFSMTHQFSAGEQAFIELAVVSILQFFFCFFLVSFSLELTPITPLLSINVFAFEKESLFDEYQIESKANNEIPMIINLPNFLRAVRVSSFLVNSAKWLFWTELKFLFFSFSLN